MNNGRQIFFKLMVRGPLMVQEKCLFYEATTANR